MPKTEKIILNQLLEFSEDMFAAGAFDSDALEEIKEITSRSAPKNINSRNLKFKGHSSVVRTK